MTPLAAILIFGLSVSQVDPGRQASALIDKLRSERIEDRNEAMERLIELGNKTFPELRKVVRDPNPEVAAAASWILQVVPVRERLTPRLRKADPGLELRLIYGNEKVWTEVFLELAVPLLRKQASGYRNEDLAGLAAPAIRSADQPATVIEYAGMLGLKTAVPEILKYIHDEKASRHALRALARLKVRIAIPEILKLLKNPSPKVRAHGVEMLGVIGSRETYPHLARLLKDDSAYVAGKAALALARACCKEYASAIGDLLGVEDNNLRWYAVDALGILGAREESGRIARMLRIDDPQLRWMTLKTLTTLEAKDAVPEIKRLLETAKNPKTRRLAKGALRSLSPPEGDR